MGYIYFLAGLSGTSSKLNMGNVFSLATVLSDDNLVHIDDITIDPNGWALDVFVYIYNKIIVDGERIDPLDIDELRRGSPQEWLRTMFAIRKVVRYKYRTLDTFTVTDFDSSGRKKKTLIFEGEIPNPFYRALNYINYSTLLTRSQIERFRGDFKN